MGRLWSHLPFKAATCQGQPSFLPWNSYWLIQYSAHLTSQHYLALFIKVLSLLGFHSPCFPPTSQAAPYYSPLLVLLVYQTSKHWGPQGPILGPSFCYTELTSLGDLLTLTSNNIYALNSQVFISSRDTCSQLQTLYIWFLLDNPHG